MTLPSAPVHRPEPAPTGSRRNRLLIWVTVAFAVLTCGLLAVQGGEVREALAEVSAWAAVGAVATQLCWLGCREEAWRVALNAVGTETVPRGRAHVANALAFLVPNRGRSVTIQ